MSSLNVSFGTGPALRTFNYTTKCVLASDLDDNVLAGCGDNILPAGDGVATGQTTRTASTITDEITGLDPLIEYQCYVIVDAPKSEKCQPVDTPVIPFPIDLSIRGSAVNRAGGGWFVEDALNDTFSDVGFEAVVAAGAVWSSMSGERYVLSLDGVAEAGLWYTPNITGWLEEAVPFPGTLGSPNAFVQITTGDIATTFPSPDIGIQISGKRMVAWNPTTGTLYLAKDFTTGNWDRTWVVANSAQFASISGNLVAEVVTDGTDYSIVLHPNAFADVTTGSVTIPINSTDGTVTVDSVSVNGPFMAYTTRLDATSGVADDKSQIWAIDLRTLQEPNAQFVPTEIPVPEGAIWDTLTSGSNVAVDGALQVANFYNKMVVTFTQNVGTCVPNNDCGNFASTEDYTTVTGTTWNTFTAGWIYRQQLSSPQLVPSGISL